MAEAILKNANRAKFYTNQIPFNLYDRLYYINVSPMFPTEICISFSVVNLILFDNVDNDPDRIVIKPCSSLNELNNLLNIAFGHLNSAEVTIAMLESFCFSYLQPRTKNARK